MLKPERKRWPWMLVLVMGVAAAVFHQQIVGRVAYAIEKGKIEANTDELTVAPGVEALSHAFRMVAKTARPSVVRIIVTRKSKAPTSGEMPEMLRRFFEEHGGGMDIEPRTPRPEMASGSGVVIDADKGYILTNNHVITGAELLQVVLADGRRTTGDVLGTDEATDLALIHVKAERLHAAKLGDSDQMEVGDWVLAIGAPFGLEQTVSQGIISAKGRNNLDITSYGDFIQTDAAINPGNSGGPLVNMHGEVIGINTAIATNPVFAGYMGIGFAIPSNMARQLLPYLEEGKKVARGYLGVRIQSVADQEGLAKNLGLDSEIGVVITDVYDDTPASKAGLQVGDVVYEIDGKEVKDNGHLTTMIAATPPGTKVKLSVLRGKERIKVDVTVGEQPEGFNPRGLAPGGKPGETDEGDETAEIKDLGVTVSRITPELARRYGWPDDEREGVIVTKSDPFNDMAQRFRPGDLIISVRGEKVRSPRHLKSLVTPETLKEGIRMWVKDRQGQRLVFVKKD